MCQNFYLFRVLGISFINLHYKKKLYVSCALSKHLQFVSKDGFDLSLAAMEYAGKRNFQNFPEFSLNGTLL